MILQTLGTIRLVRSDGTELDELLRQPKRLALLAYLCSPRPGAWHRRDVLVAAFWPGLDTPHARTALRNSLYVLRQHLEDGVIRTRGDEEVSIDPTRLETDVALLEADLQAGRFAESLARYGGDALPGLHVADSEGFEAWIDDERLRTRSLARSAAIRLADACEQRGDLTGAADALTRVIRLDPVDESFVRRLVGLLDRAGDRAGALDAYERFRVRLAEEFDAEPAEETVRLVDEIRARRAVRSPSPQSERIPGDDSLASSKLKETAGSDGLCVPIAVADNPDGAWRGLGASGDPPTNPMGHANRPAGQFHKVGHRCGPDSTGS